MICTYCKQHFAPFPDEDFINDLPLPPGKGIIARHEESHKRRMKVYWNNELGECGCDEQIAGVGR